MGFSNCNKTNVAKVDDNTIATTIIIKLFNKTVT